MRKTQGKNQDAPGLTWTIGGPLIPRSRSNSSSALSLGSDVERDEVEEEVEGLKIDRKLRFDLGDEDFGLGDLEGVACARLRIAMESARECTG